MATTDPGAPGPADPVPPVGVTALLPLPDVFRVADALADTDPLGDTDLLGVADPVALTFGVPEPVDVAVGVAVWLGQPPDGVGPIVWLVGALCVGLGFGVLLGFGVAVALLVPVALVVGVELSVGVTLVVELGVPVALAVAWLACTVGLDERTEGLACAADTSDPVGVGDDEQDGSAVGAPPPVGTPAAAALPSGVPPALPDELGAGLCALRPAAWRIGLRSGGTAASTTPTANTARPTASAGRSIASRQSQDPCGACRAWDGPEPRLLTGGHSAASLVRSACQRRGRPPRKAAIAALRDWVAVT